MNEMKAILNLITLILIVGGRVPGLTAQEDPCLNRTIEVNVITDDFRLVKGLDSSHFEGKFHGKPIDITSAEYDTGSRRVVILLDSSGSMGVPDDHWRPGVTMAADIVSSAPPQTSFALLRFNDTTTKQADFTDQRMTLTSRLNDIWHWNGSDFKGKTAIMDAILDGIATLGQLHVGDTIFLITDGGDNKSKISDKVFMRTLLASGVRIFVFYLASDFKSRGRTPEEAVGPETLRSIVEFTGGDLSVFPPSRGLFPSLTSDFELEMEAENPKLIPMVAQLFVHEFSEIYLLRIKFTEPVDKPGKLDLQVVYHDGKKNHHLRVIYPHRLAPCS
ncbi:MAG TPA: VWA domain-containing protein [Terriglobia bacterium]|nr:VWA domain-containing protein [Terriglobia bacterium]